MSTVIFRDHLENRPVEEQSEQLNEVKEDVAVFLLHPDDVGQGKGPLGVDASVGRGGPGEETELEAVLHHNSQLRRTEVEELRVLDCALTVRNISAYLNRFLYFRVNK